MRIHSLRLAALGPFAGEEFVDFDALGPSALFLIDGPTGAGKSTVIDAIVFALYGDVAGESSDKERLRSALASPETESFAELDFSTVAGRFRVRRTPAYERAKKRGTGTTAESATVQVWRSVGEQTWEPLSVRHGEADAEIARAIGLTRSQFLQTVVLPQGEFATFLRSESADRLPILERIFATEVYSRIQSAFDDERRAALREHEQSLLALQSARDVLRGQLEGSGIEFEIAHDLDAWPAERESLIERLKARASGSAERVHACELVMAEASARMDAQVAARQAAQSLAAARAQLSEIQLRVEALESECGVDDLAESLTEAITGLDTELESGAADAEVEQRIPELEGQLALAIQLAERLEGSLKQLELDRDVVIPSRMAAIIAGLRDEVRAEEASVAAQERHVGELRAARISGLSGELALSLADGIPCPVCGSPEHPSPAPVRADHVDADVVAAEEGILSARRAELADLRTDVAVLTAALPATAGDIDPVRAERAQLLEDLQSDLDALAGIAKRIEHTRSERAGAQSAIDDVSARLVADRDRVLLARGQHDSVESRMNLLRSRRDSLVGLRQARALRDQARHALELMDSDESLPVHDEALLAAAESARNEAGAAVKRATAISTADARLLGGVTELCAQVDAAQGAYEVVVESSAATIRLAQALNGAQGQSLSAYVVQRAFDEVVEAANSRLTAMLGGHFRLVTTQERTGSRRTGLGLGLKVRDLRTDTERRTTTLSGGESFCASLALALGLADSVRAHAGGVEIGMLFIDEGFGALDSERLGDVMAELLRLRADGRSVGVISHVTEMKRAIPERIDVVPGPSGSTLSVRWMT